jgi:osmotically-inducible protein OsmY
MTLIFETLALCALLNGTPAATKGAAAQAVEIKHGKAGDAQTPLDQSNDKKDVALTQQIRKAVMAQELSFNAKNVKIITRSAEVTLRGEVASAAERDTICALAAKVPGVVVVNDQMEVHAN